jgi:hypothetical protein
MSTFSTPFGVPYDTALSFTYKRAIGSLSIPRTGLIGLWLVRNGVVNTSIVAVGDYALLTQEWQDVFFSDPSTPIVFADFDALWAAVSSVTDLNKSIVIGNELIGVAIYEIGTPYQVLDKALMYFNELGVPLAVDGIQLTIDNNIIYVQ